FQYLLPRLTIPLFLLHDTTTPTINPLSLHDALPIYAQWEANASRRGEADQLQRYRKEAELIEFPNVSEGIDAIYEVVDGDVRLRSEEHTSELQSRFDLVCRLLLEKKNNTIKRIQ